MHVIQSELVTLCKIEHHVANHVLDLHAVQRTLGAAHVVPHESDHLQCAIDALQVAFTAREHHLTRGEQQRRAARLLKTDRDGRELLLGIATVWNHTAQNAQVEYTRARAYHCSAHQVVYIQRWTRQVSYDRGLAADVIVRVDILQKHIRVMGALIELAILALAHLHHAC